MKPVVVSVDVERPAEEVFAYLDEVENNPEWLAGMQTARWITEPPRRVGSRYEQVAKFLGKEIRTTFEVVDHQPGRRVTIRSLEGSSFPLTVTRQVDPLDDRRCRVTETVESDPSGFYKVVGPVLHAMVRSRIARDYRRLAKQLGR
jgi:uncharacterized membrane protein